MTFAYDFVTLISHAINLLKNNIDMNIIAQATGLSIEEIQELQNTIHLKS